MNKLFYRIIFNKARGMLMVVADIARSGYSCRQRPQRRTARCIGRCLRLNPLSFALWLAAGCVSLSARAGIVADTSAPAQQQPTVLSTASGLPQVNIQTPSQGGVSRNRYSEFNVDGQGVILNNSHKNSQTQIGGMVAANPWLAKQEARIILNEVNSRNPSQLNGFIEVAGKRAEVVIANPAGITCNGCGFINASQNTLTTGQAMVENGQLKGFDVNGGHIGIEGKGFNGSDADYTRLIAQSVTVNARLQTGELQVVTGRNTTDAAGNVRGVKTDKAADKPVYALDVAALGGMYANKITLLGTEKGVGVHNAGELGAFAGELHLTADGRLDNTGTLQSRDALQLTLQGDLNNSGTLITSQEARLSAGGTLRNTGMVRAGGAASLAARRIESPDGSTLAAGADRNGNLSQPGELQLTAPGAISARGRNLSSSGIQARGSQLDLSGSQTAGAAIQLTATQGDIATRSALLRGDTVTVTTPTALDNDDGQISAGRLAVTAPVISNNRGLLRQENTQDLTVHSRALHNKQGVITSGGNMALLADGIDNQQGIIAGNGHDFSLQATQLNNQSGRIQLAGEGMLSLHAAQLDGQQGQLLSAGSLAITGQQLDLSHGETTARALSVTGDTLRHQGGRLIQTGPGEMPLTVTGAVDNRDGELASAGGLRLSSSKLDNRNGTVVTASGTDLSLAIAGAADNQQGTLQAGRSLTLTADHLNNQRGLTAATDGQLQLTTQQGTDNTGGQLEARHQLGLYSQTFTNRQGILQGDQVSVDTRQFDLLNEGGYIAAVNTLSVNSGALDNGAGEVTAGHDFSLTSGTLTNTGGLLQAGGDLTLDTGHQSINNSDSGTRGGIVALQNLHLHGGDLNNQAGFLAAGGQADLTIGSLDNRQGEMVANGGLALSGADTNNDHGQIRSAGDLQLDTADQVISSRQGLIAGSGATGIISGGLDNQQGNIQGGRELNLIMPAHRLLNGGGTLLSGGTLKLQATQLDNPGGTVQTVGDGRLITGEQLNNQGGLVRGGASLTITTPQITNSDTRPSSGGIEASALTLSTDHLDNHNGAVRAGNVLNGTIGQTLDNRQGLLSSAADLSVLGSQLVVTNTQGTLIADNHAQLNVAAVTGDGELLSQGDLELNLQSDFHNQATIETSGRLQLTARGTITNDGLIASQGPLALTGDDIINNQPAVIKTNGALQLTAAKEITNNGQITSQQALSLTGNNITNNADASISASRTDVVASGTLTNRGLIDGDLTHLVAGTLNNDGSGRIYGDHIALAAGTLNNLSDGQHAPVIAARDTLDIGAGTINNRHHALIYSMGALNLGGRLDDNYHATGQGHQLNNEAATVEAAGHATIDMADISNTNGGLSTTLAEISRTPYHELVMKGETQRYNWADADVSQTNKYNVSDAILPGGRRGNEFYEYRYTRVIKETQVTASDPGKIYAGGDLTFTASRLSNHDSQIVAGGSLGGNLGELDNQATAGVRITTDSGQQVRWYAKKSHKRTGGTKTSQGKDWSGYQPPVITETVDLDPRLWQSDTAPDSGGYQTEHRTVSVADRLSRRVAPPDSVRQDNVAPPAKVVLRNPVQEVPLATSSLPAGQTVTPVIRTVTPATRLPDNSLFQLHPGTDSHFLVETDPRFTRQSTWLSSDYMQSSLSGDNLHKRLGDGFYEQSLIRDQIIELTGNRYIGDFSSDEEQYKGLMDNGIAFGKQYHLQTGVALTPEQMALLTSDIVWLVDETVTLPDGSQETIQIPQVYAKLKTGDLTGDGTLLSAGEVTLNSEHNLINSGVIQGRDITRLTAQSLQNSGTLLGNGVDLLARQDLTNSGGTIRGGEQVSLRAGHDIISASTLRQEGENSWLDRPAGIYVGSDKGSLALTALNNITLSASEVSNSGSGITRLQAGQDLQLATQTTRYHQRGDWGDQNYRDLVQQTDTGTTLAAQGNMQLVAGQDLQARAADVTAGQSLQALAGRDIRLTTGDAITDLTEHSHQQSNSLLSKHSLETHDEIHDRLGISTTLSGEQVALQAGQNLTLQGSNVAGTGAVALTAGADLSLQAASELHQENHWREEKKSGLFGTGGIGFTIGKAAQKTTSDAEGNQSLGSTAGSSQGTVQLAAGNHVSVTGSDLVAGQDLSVSGQNVTVQAAENSQTVLTRTEQSQSGFTLALSGTVGSALNAAAQTATDAHKTGDSRLGALKETKAALSGAQAVQAYDSDEAQTAAADAKNLANGLKPGDDGYQKGATNTVGVTLSYGSQSSRSESRTDSLQSQGSSLDAGRDLTITATGDGPDSGDIRITGSALKAGNDLSLDAKRDIALLSAQNSERTTGKNSSQGGSIGAGIGVGSGGAGISISASVNGGRGHENGNGVTHTETTLDAGSTVSLGSGGDTTLQGAQVSGNKIIADIGHSLTLTSEQDSDDYDSKQENISAGGSFTFGSMNGTASVNASRQKINSQFDSVQEQTGLFAGSGGYNVTTGDHTQLNGAVITSTGTADKNRLDTGTLGWQSIENHADYQSQSVSTGVSTGSPAGAVGSLGQSLSGGNHSGHAAGTSYAAISDGELQVRDSAAQKQDTATLSHDTLHASGSLSPIFDKEKEQKRLQTSQLIGDISQQLTEMAMTQGQINASREAVTALSASSAADRAAAEKKWQEANPGQTATAAAITGQLYDDAYNRALTQSGYGTGGSVQRLIQAGTAVAQGLSGGSVVSAVAGGMAPYLAEAIHIATTDEETKQVNRGANLLAHTALGALVAGLEGNSALAGGTGALAGEGSAQLMAPDGSSALSEAQKQELSGLATLAAGVAGGLTGGTDGIYSGAQAGKNAVDNNTLAGDFLRQSHRDGIEQLKDEIRENVGKNTVSQIANGVLGTYGNTVDLGAGVADTALDAVLALSSCVEGMSYCDTAINDLKRANQTADDAMQALVTGQTWDVVQKSFLKSLTGDQSALEDMAGIISSLLVPVKSVTLSAGKTADIMAESGMLNKAENLPGNVLNDTVNSGRVSDQAALAEIDGEGNVIQGGSNSLQINEQVTASIGESGAGNSASHFGEYATSEQALIAEGGSANKGNAATNNINQSLKLGETRVVNEVSVTRVGRWMSPDELAQMQSTGKVVQGGGGQTFISINGVNDFKGAAPKGSVYVEFDVPSNSLIQGGNGGWYKMLGPNASGSQKYLLEKQGGSLTPNIINTNIIDTK